MWIESFIRRARIANDSLIRIPEYLALRWKRYCRSVGRLRRREAIGTSSVAGEELNVDQVPGELGTSSHPLALLRLDAINRVRRIKTGPVGEVSALNEAIAPCRPPDEELADLEVRDLLKAALRQLNPVEAWVLRERYGLHDFTHDEKTWTDPDTSAADRVTSACLSESQSDQSRTSRSRRFRPYRELERDCGLSSHRLRQVERAALGKLRHLLAPWFKPEL
jgi:hypothetical protein